MPTTAITICNLALGRISVSQFIESLDEDTNQALVCDQFYEGCRDRVLRDFPWPFATQYATLALVEEDPNDDWAYAYRYPADAIAARRIVNGMVEIPAGCTLTDLGLSVPGLPKIPFNIGQDDTGQLIYTNQSEAVLEYTKQMTDPARFDPQFVSALAWCLAAEIAMPLAVSVGLADRAMKMYLMELDRARRQAINESVKPPPPDSEFISSRG